MSQIEEIKDRIDIVDIVSETVQLRRSGKNYVGFCPFHQNTRTPSFVVFPETGTWRCFSECNDGGDVFSYVMKKEGWDFSEALESLAKRAGVELKPISPQDIEQKDKNEALRNLMTDSIVYFQNNLQKPEGKFALDYVRARKFSDETLLNFEIGYALDDYEATQSFLINKGYTKEQIVKAGIAYQRDDGRTTDRFRHRLMIPIRDDKGRPVGFGARALRKEENAKYLNSPQSPIFDKSKLLFGMDKAKKSIREKDQAIIVEGYMGVILLHQAGFTNVVAQMGTALTEQQLRILKKRTLNFVLALDSDSAGLKATMRGLEVARNTLDHSEEIRFDVFGLISKEARLKADIRVASLPPGQDPDDVVNESKEQWEKIIQDAKPIVEHVMQTLIKNLDISNPKNKSKIAEQVVPLIKDIPDAIERDHYTQRLASLLSIDVNSLYDLTRRRQAKSQKRRGSLAEIETVEQSQPRFSINDKESIVVLLERYYLSCVLRNPELIYPLNRLLKASGLDDVSINDFTEITHQVLFSNCEKSLSQEHSSPSSYVMELTHENLIDIVDEILQITKEDDLSHNLFKKEFVRSFLILRQKRLQQINQELKLLLKETNPEEKIILENLSQSLKENNKIQFTLDKALSTIHENIIKPKR